ncbi:methyltransferase family protein [Pontibacter ummariensis]|uniref:Methyltransferase domain-containing protein n=1 Tax=Pontibacter ummariensis TaxID=1610492 RepID=A0A239KSH4_9BACT|nr:class I SAM-dependent methyltransferase [Pontibacter ummariensis]PRY05005.1 methyltransferase family protein [Pontibacter ummariensis]SNT21005.1 Methyltransferase domain-containing protein [Pontibacter ummariensis]
MQEFWNNRYSQEDMTYGSAPNVFFREQLKKLTPGKLLLPAEGEGRNAVHAALKGWEVLAFDYSEAGRAKALWLAQQQGVSINYRLAEAAEFDREPNSLNAVALIYAHFLPVLRERLHRNVIQWLKPGGVVILEAFHPGQLAYASGGPKDQRMLYTAGMLRSDFTPLEINLLEEQETLLKEGAYHSGAGCVTRMVATKPGAAESKA